MTTNDSQMTENITVNTAPFSVLAESKQKYFATKLMIRKLRLIDSNICLNFFICNLPNVIVRLSSLVSCLTPIISKIITRLR